MPSFDVVSSVDMQEIDNAVNQAMREIGQRYDFRGSKSTLTFEQPIIKMVADDDYKANAVLDILRQKCAKRSVDLKVLDVGKFESGSTGEIRCEIKLKQGIPTDTAKAMVKSIKGTKIKVQAQIQDDQLRVTGKKRDDLQEIMAHLKAGPYELPLQFTNFRD
jgi:cyclic-di-GMP-binding protein